MNASDGFELSTVVHLVRPWGEPVHDLDQLRAAIELAPADVLFHHTVQVQLRDPTAVELPSDDLSAWVAVVVQDRESAERISFAVQSHNGSPEEVRDALREALDSVPQNERTLRRAPHEGSFQLLAAESLGLPTGTVVHNAEELVVALVTADPGVWFRHVIEEPWYGAGRSSLVEWLMSSGEQRLAGWLRDATVAGQAIERARDRLMRRWRQSQLARRLAEASASPEDVRREAGRDAVARLVRRVTRSEAES
jgi:hypothetical protein